MVKMVMLRHCIVYFIFCTCTQFFIRKVFEINRKTSFDLTKLIKLEIIKLDQA